MILSNSVIFSEEIVARYYGITIPLLNNKAETIADIVSALLLGLLTAPLDYSVIRLFFFCDTV